MQANANERSTYTVAYPRFPAQEFSSCCCAIRSQDADAADGDVVARRSVGKGKDARSGSQNFLSEELPKTKLGIGGVRIVQ